MSSSTIRMYACKIEDSALTDRERERSSAARSSLAASATASSKRAISSSAARFGM
jgi:hypothetical protein